MKIQESAIQFIKKNKRLLIKTFANEKIFKPALRPMSLFMAGSPGAGKTEYSKAIIKFFNYPIVCIDADDIRNIIPQYDKTNAYQVQRAAALGVDILHSHALKKKLHFILDATFANYKISSVNVKRSLQKAREVTVFYVYQDPFIAWEFTKEREKLEGRHVPKKVFIDAVFNAKVNIKRIKQEFGKQVIVFMVRKDYRNNTEQQWGDVTRQEIDKYIKIPYTKTELAKSLPIVI